MNLDKNTVLTLDRQNEHISHNWTLWPQNDLFKGGSKDFHLALQTVHEIPQGVGFNGVWRGVSSEEVVSSD